MPHVVLLGDSVFDNASYVRGGPDVVAQLRAHLPPGWSATNCAVDGATASGVSGQLRRVPADSTHLALSVGGNDALRLSPLLHQLHRPFGAAAHDLVAARKRFWSDYRAALDALATRGLPTIVCTVYDAVPGLTEVGAALLSTFNDVITREAAARGLPVIDLRLLCADEADYSDVSPIEPSIRGGDKIAAAIARLVTGGHDFGGGRCVVYVG
ncbi:MAG TPA: SGNH/GDSL hydrolase family protein [Humisphaera sp.]